MFFESLPCSKTTGLGYNNPESKNGISSELTQVIKSDKQTGNKLMQKIASKILAQEQESASVDKKEFNLGESRNLS
jgi:hypothetical protein